MKRLDLRLILGGFLLIAAVLACNLSLKLPSNPKPPVPSLVPQASDADAFEQNFQQAANQAAQSGNFTTSITQQQFSSWLALRAPGYAKQQGYEWPLKDVQAGLDDGKITLYGVITQPNVPETPAQVIFTPSIASDGELAVNVEGGQVGMVGVPPDILKNLNKTIQDVLASQLNQIKGRYKLTSLNVTGGTLTVSGQVVR